MDSYTVTGRLSRFSAMIKTGENNEKIAFYRITYSLGTINVPLLASPYPKTGDGARNIIYLVVIMVEMKIRR